MNASMTASYTRRSLLTVICEASIESLVAADARRLGAHGYTARDARELDIMNYLPRAVSVDDVFDRIDRMLKRTGDPFTQT